MSPVVENTRSLGIEVAGTERYSFARLESKGYLEFAVYFPPRQRAATERDRDLFSVVFNFPSHPSMICWTALTQKRKCSLAGPIVLSF